MWWCTFGRSQHRSTASSHKPRENIHLTRPARRWLRDLADEAGVARDHEGGQRPHDGLQKPDRGGESLAGGRCRVEVAAVADAGRTEREASVDAQSD